MNRVSFGSSMCSGLSSARIKGRCIGGTRVFFPIFLKLQSRMLPLQRKANTRLSVCVQNQRQTTQKKVRDRCTILFTYSSPTSLLLHQHLQLQLKPPIIASDA